LKTNTYSSNLISSIRLPTHKNLEAKFFYNFFTKDEAVVEAPAPNTSAYAKEKDKMRKSPRYVTLNFITQKDVEKSNINKLEIVKSNISRIYGAEDVGNSSATSIVTQDTSISDRLYQTIMRSAQLRNIEGNMTDVSQELGKILGPAIDRELLQTLSVSYAEAGAQFVSDRSTINLNKFDDVKQNPISYTINDKFISDLISNSENSSIVGQTTSLGFLTEKTKEIQNRCRSISPVIASSDFLTILEPVSISHSTIGEFSSGIVNVATLVYRNETKQDGSTESKLIDVISPGASSYVDYKVKLGAQYSYWLHAVYLVVTTALTSDTGDILRAEILFQSKPSNASTVFLFDDVPPEPPADFNVRWDYQNNNLVLSWVFPVNPRQDVKYFQVFRRETIEQPFELLMEYDFNDSLKQPVRFENVLENLTKKLTSPYNVYVDTAFKKDSKYIYAVACVDARGLVSNYSHQFEATFDKIKNVLIKKSISPQGAPRQYPNIFIKQNFFQDLILTSKKRRANIYFDPEYLKLKSIDGSIVDAVRTEGTGGYCINILDVTRGQVTSVPITITDLLRTTSS
jgi:hypothetical protein